MPAKLEDLGEREIVRRVKALLGKPHWGIGLGDDTAAMLIGDSYFLVTTDVMFGRTHVPEPATPFQTGWYVAAINFSDIAAMGGKPLGLLMALGMPRDMEYEELEQCVLGAQTCCSEYETEIIGGDTKESEEFTIAGTAVGTVPKEGILLRKGSQPGDQLCVTGPLGRAACGYFALKRELDLEDAIGALLTPRPRLREGMVLSSTGCVTACMDISDGLASSLHQMTEVGGAHFRVAYEEVPKSQDLGAFPDIPQEDLVLHFGGDYELVFTVRRDRLWDVQKELERTGSQLWRIGEVTSAQENTITKGQVEQPLPDIGWEHLSPATLRHFKY